VGVCTSSVKSCPAGIWASASLPFTTNTPTPPYTHR
jgi:hypothetical protein